MAENPLCKVCQGEGKPNPSRAVDVHHVSGRGSKTNDVTTWLPVCRDCHGKIHFGATTQIPVNSLRSLTASKPTNTMTQHNDTNTTDSLAVDSASAGSIPLLQMATNPQHGYGLMNWNQVDQWGYANNPIWYRVHQMAQHHGLDEVTKLRVLSDALMRQNVELQDRCKDLIARLPIPPISIQSNRVLS